MELDAGNPSALTEFAKAQGWISASQYVAELTIAGDGNMNRVLRARLNDTTSLVFKQSLPYVAKYPDIPAPLERLDAETDFYATIAPHNALVEHTPAIVGYAKSEHLLCMQDLGTARDMTYLYAQADHDEDIRLATLWDWLSKLHSLSLTDVQAAGFDNAAMRALNHEHIFDIPLREDNGLTFSNALTGSAQALRQDNAFADAAHHLGEIYLGHAAHDSRACLLHGDFYPGSWLACDTSGVMVIDPEFTFFGAPEFDVGVMQAHLRLAGVEHTHILRMLQAYAKPPGFSPQLAMQFSGMEITRRLLGVAQLPLNLSDANKQRMLALARNLVVEKDVYEGG